MSWRDEFFFHRGYNCTIEHQIEDGKIKAIHYISDKTGAEIFADITPYDSSAETLRLWIDAGMPDRVGNEPLTREDLEKMIYEQA